MKSRVLLMVVVRSSTLPLRARSVVLVTCGLGWDFIGAMEPKLRSSLLPLAVDRLVLVFLTKYSLLSAFWFGVGSSTRSPSSPGDESCGGVELEDMRPAGLA